MEEKNELNDKEINMFPALDTLLSIIQKEYEYESDRAKSFENRTGFFLTFTGALLVFLLTNYKFPNIITKKLATFRDIMPYAIFIISISLTFLTLIASIFCFIKVISIKKYNRIKVNGLTEEFAKGEKERVEMGLILDYRDATLFNTEVNDKKAKWYKGGLYLILSSLVFTIVTYVISFLLS